MEVGLFLHDDCLPVADDQLLLRYEILPRSLFVTLFPDGLRHPNYVLAELVVVFPARLLDHLF